MSEASTGGEAPGADTGEQMVALSAVLDILHRRDATIGTRLDELEASAPGPLASPEFTVRYGRKVAALAARREEIVGIETDVKALPTAQSHP